MATSTNGPSMIRRPGERLPKEGSAGSEHVGGAALAAAAQAALVGLVAIEAPVLLAWLITPGPTASWQQAWQFGIDVWLLAQHCGLNVAGGHLGLSPLGLSVLPVAASFFAARRLARVLDPQAERISAGLTRARRRMPPVRALVTFAAGYGGLAGLLSQLAQGGFGEPVTAQVLVAGIVLAGSAALAGFVAYRFDGLRPGLIALLRRSPVPNRVLVWVRPVWSVVLVQLAGAGLVLIGAVGHGWGRMVGLQQALGAGWGGGVILVLLQLVLLPNLLVWAVAVCAGPGFSVGVGSVISIHEVSTGALPLIPVLGALPDPGTPAGWAQSLLAVPLLAGVAGGVTLCRRGLRHQRAHQFGQLIRDAVGIGLSGAAVFVVLTWLASGAAGPGRMAVVGADPLLVGLWLALEFSLGAGLAVLALTLPSLRSVAGYRLVP